MLIGIAHAAPDSHSSEAQLAKSLQAINNNRLDIALNEVNDLLRVNPNFKLAQLVKGDLLMARAGAIDKFGSAANAPREKIDDLRDEARVRLQRVMTQPDSKNLPRYLWKLDSKQKYVLVADASRSTLYVYENIDGEPRYVADYYITIGKLGTEKMAAGDQRTPIGVYFVKANLPKNKLADMYGNGAFPLSYPNEWDKKNGRTGQGIWLHGTPSDTYSRPPRASNGCLVLANEDMDKLAPYLQVGVTPIIITNQIDWINEQDQNDRNALLAEIEQWRKDWSSLNTNVYLKHYAPSFSSENMKYAAWAKQKQLVNSGKSWIKVNLSEVSIFTYPDQPDMAVVNFEQDYSSSNLTNRMKKRQYWIKQDSRWKIIFEGAASYKRLFTALFALLLCCAMQSSHSLTQGKKTMVKLHTNHGTITLELNAEKAPNTVKNFLDYVNSGFYDNTIFHRVIDDFMIQGGGFEHGMKQKKTNAPIQNEAANGLTNAPYTIAMARTSDPHSATAQFFINLKNNGFLNHMAPTPQEFGYCVFGKVVEGTDVVDKIAKVKTGFNAGHQNVPEEDVIITKAEVVK